MPVFLQNSNLLRRLSTFSLHFVCRCHISHVQYAATTNLIIGHLKLNICVNLKTQLHGQGTMSAACLCQCDAEGCQSYIYDRYESCKQNFCERCIEGHPCMEINQDVVPEVAAMPVIQLEVQPEVQPAEKKRKLGGVIVDSSIRTYYGVDGITSKRNANAVALVPCEAAVWSYFMRYNPFLHADTKSNASCNIRHQEAKTDKNIKFSVEYQVR